MTDKIRFGTEDANYLAKPVGDDDDPNSYTMRRDWADYLLEHVVDEAEYRVSSTHFGNMDRTCRKTGDDFERLDQEAYEEISEEIRSTDSYTPFVKPDRDAKFRISGRGLRTWEFKHEDFEILEAE